MIEQDLGGDSVAIYNNMFFITFSMDHSFKVKFFVTILALVNRVFYLLNRKSYLTNQPDVIDKAH